MLLDLYSAAYKSFLVSTKSSIFGLQPGSSKVLNEIPFYHLSHAFYDFVSVFLWRLSCLWEVNIFGVSTVKNWAILKFLVPYVYPNPWYKPCFSSTLYTSFLIAFLACEGSLKFLLNWLFPFLNKYLVAPKLEYLREPNLISPDIIWFPCFMNMINLLAWTLYRPQWTSRIFPS